MPTTNPLTAAEVAKLATPTSTYKKVTGQLDFTRRAIKLWMLDFNQCRNITADSNGIKTAIQAFFINDKYFPRPGSKGANEKMLWSKFEEAYLGMAKLALNESKRQKIPFGDMDSSALELPKSFIKACKIEQEQRLKRMAEAEAKPLTDY